MGELQTPFETQRATVGSGTKTMGGIREAVARKRAEVEEEQTKLDEKKEELKQRTKQCEITAKRLKERASEVAKRREQVQKLEEETKAKEGVVLSRAAEEHSLKVALEKECEEKQKELENLQHTKQETATLVDSLAVYQRFLQRVIENSDEFPTIAEVLNRHGTLVKAHKVSEATQRRLKDEVASIQAEIASLIKKRTETGLIMESEAAAKKKELEEERVKTEDLQSKVHSDSKAAVERLRLQGELLMSIRNLCARMEPTTSTPSTSEDLASTITRLSRLNERLADLYDVVIGFEEKKGDDSATKK